jgi:hypothetical protein
MVLLEFCIFNMKFGSYSYELLNSCIMLFYVTIMEWFQDQLKHVSMNLKKMCLVKEHIIGAKDIRTYIEYVDQCTNRKNL